RAWPFSSETCFMPPIQVARPSVECFTTPSLRRLTALMSMANFPVEKPYSAPRWATWAARALATRVLVGMQPLLTQVPPSSLRSTSAVFRPSLSRRPQSAGPAGTDDDRIETLCHEASIPRHRRKIALMNAPTKAEDAFHQLIHQNHMWGLWEIASQMTPHPMPQAIPHQWRWSLLKEVVRQSASAVPVGDERRAMQLFNPGLNGQWATTNTLI